MMSRGQVLRWAYKGQPFESRIMCACPTCGAHAVIALPKALRDEQPDDTTHVCHPLAGGCNGGFVQDAIMKEVDP